MRWLLACLFIVSIGCAKDPSKDVVAAKVNDETPKKTEVADTKKQAAPAAKPAQAANSQAALEGQIVFVGSKVTGSHTNRFNDWSGNVSGLDKGAAAAQLQVTVKTASAEADYLDPKPWSGKLQKHLVSADFFDSAKFPTATFVSRSIVAKAGADHQVTGDLTIRGTKKSISFPAKIGLDGGFSLNAEFSINRKDFGIVYDGTADDLIRDGVVLKLALKSKS